MLSLFRILQFFPNQINNTRSNCLEDNSDIISQLKFISKIKPGEQINVDNLSICSRNVFSGIYRSVYGESREKTFHYFSVTIRRAFEKIQAFSNTEKLSEKMLCYNIIENLEACIEGLENAKDTYKDDRRFVCDIETMIESVQAKLNELKITKPELFKYLEKPLSDKKTNQTFQV